MSRSDQNQLNQLRDRAEALLADMGKTGKDQLAVHDMASVMHDLSVHQIELEMQNEELRKAQSDLQQTQDEYHALYHNVPVGYLTLDRHGMILKHNQTFSAMLQDGGRKFTGTPFTNFIVSEDQGVFLARYKAFLKNPQEKNIDLRLVRQDGALLWVRLTGRIGPAKHANDEEISTLLMTVADINSEKIAEEENRVLEQQLHQTQKLESLGVLTGGIAHDFNNILAIIIGNCDLAKLQPSKAEQLLPNIKHSAQRAADLCRQMLDYAGTSLMTVQQVKLADLVADILQMLKATTRKNVIIRSNFSFELPEIKGDASQLRQVVMNLVINAAEAIGDKHGEIRVELAVASLAGEPPQTDHLGKIIAAGQYVCLKVTDSGCGMDDETRQRIFEPFYSTKFAGRGLGMSAVLGIIKAHKGALQLFSQPEKGTTFKVYLPLLRSDVAVESPLPLAVMKEWQGSGMVLLVEDEPQLRNVAKDLIMALGFSVIDAENGIRALELYHQHTSEITLVVTDIDMPVMDGYELFTKLKEQAPDLPIILSSGFGEKVVFSRISNGEAAGFLSKPYSFDQLCEALRNTVEGTRIARS